MEKMFYSNKEINICGVCNVSGIGTAITSYSFLTLVLLSAFYKETKALAVNNRMRTHRHLNPPLFH